MPRIPLLLPSLAVGILLLGAASSAYGQEPGSVRAVGMLAVDEVPAAVKEAAWTSVTGPDGEGKNGPMSTVGLELALLYHQSRLQGKSGVRTLRDVPDRSPAKASVGEQENRPVARGVGRARIHSPISENGRFVTVDAVASRRPSELLGDLRSLGLEEEAVAGNVVSGRLPVAAIKDAAQLASLRGMLPSRTQTLAGSVGSEADTAHFADEARTDLGVEGSGQKVCVMSDSYNQNASVLTSASEDIQSGDLPGSGNPEGRTIPVDVLDDSESDGSDEGRAMLQLVHDIAPRASLGFHTAFGGLGDFAQGIRELANAGCTVIVDDIRNGVEPFYQDGPVSNAVDEVVERDGVAYFSSAGNSGQNSYEAPFRGSGEPGVINESSKLHDFDSTATTDTRQEIKIGVREGEDDGEFRISSFQWTDPSAFVSGSEGADTDLDIALLDDTLGIVAQSARDSDANGVPFESLEYANSGDIDTDNDGVADSTFHLVVERAAGPDPEEVKYVYSGSSFEVKEYDTLGPTVFGHSVAEGAIAVAAAPFFNTAEYNVSVDSSAVLEFFSAKGGVPIRFDQNGDPISPVVRQKPEVTSADWIDNTFFGTGLNISDPDPHPNFVGTSAAAPNIAGIAALIREARPTFSPVEVYNRLESSAVDVRLRQTLEDGTITTDKTGAGVDPWSGHGFVRADRAVPSPVGVQIGELSATGSVTSPSQGTVEVSWEQVGEGEIDEFVVERQYLSAPLTEQARVPADGAGPFRTVVEGLPIGEHMFRVTALRNDSALVTREVSVTLRRQEANLMVYPNPFGKTANLSLTLPEDQNREQRIRVAIFDALGRRVATPIRSRTIHKNSESIFLGPGAIPSLGNGVYFFHVVGETFVETARAVHAREE